MNDQFTDAAILAEDNDRLRAEIRKLRAPNQTIMTPTFLVPLWFIFLAAIAYRVAMSWMEAHRRLEELHEHMEQVDRRTERAHAEVKQAIERENERTREMVHALGRRWKS